jgi:hypothetical protein
MSFLIYTYIVPSGLHDNLAVTMRKCCRRTVQMVKLGVMFKTLASFHRSLLISPTNPSLTRTQSNCSSSPEISTRAFVDVQVLEFDATVAVVSVRIATLRFCNTLGGWPSLSAMFVLMKSCSGMVLSMYKMAGEGRVATSVTKRPPCVPIVEAELTANDGTLELRFSTLSSRVHRTHTGSTIGGGRAGSKGTNRSSRSDDRLHLNRPVRWTLTLNQYFTSAKPLCFGT